MWDTMWPKPDREWVRSLPEQLGPRKFRLLVNACCRHLLEPAMERALQKHSSAVVVQREVLAALDVSDRFADTGKSKAALKRALKELNSVSGAHWPFHGASLMMTCLLSKEPTHTLYQCAAQWAFKITPDELVPHLRHLARDLAPPSGHDGADDGSLSGEAVELARRSMRSERFSKCRSWQMCSNHPVATT